MRRIALLVTLAGAFLALSASAHAVPIAGCGTVIVAPGTYELVADLNCPVGVAVTVASDFVNVNLAGFTISGLGAGSIGIDVTDGSDDVFVFGAGTIRGFDTGIEAGDCAFGLGADTNNLAIESVTVRNSRSYGIALCPLGGSAQVNFSQIVGTDGTGIDNPGLAGIGGTVSIQGVVVRDALVGIRLDPLAGGSAVVRATAVVDAASTAVFLGGTGYSEFSDGWIRCPSSACTKGISMSSHDSSSLIARNQISGVELAGIEVLAGGCCPISTVVVEDNVVASVGGASPIFHGAIVTQDRSALVRRNTVRNVAGGPGIHVICANAAGVEDNVLRSVEGDGIVLDDDPIPGTSCSFGGTNADVVAGNLVRGAGGNGIAVPVGLDHQLTGNTVVGSGLDGYLVGSAATGFLTDNRARGNAGDGFQLDTGALELSGNTARRNGGWGFLTVAPVTDLGGNRARNNTLGDCDPAHLAC